MNGRHDAEPHEGMHAACGAGAAAPLLCQVAGCRAAVGSPLASLAEQHCQLSAALAAAQQGAQAVAAQAELQQRLAEFDAQLHSGGSPRHSVACNAASD